MDAKVAVKKVMQSSNQNISNAQAKIKEYLGEDMKMIKNEENNNVLFQSQDELREVRFDVNDPAPHQNPHTHVIEYTQVKNNKKELYNERVYPNDVDPE